MDAMQKSECDTVMEETMASCEALKKSGHLLAVEQLEPVQMAMSVRARNRKVSVTGGPFGETRNSSVSISLSARDLSEALQAWRFPSVRFGTMEVRPVRGVRTQQLLLHRNMRQKDTE